MWKPEEQLLLGDVKDCVSDKWVLRGRLQVLNYVGPWSKSITEGKLNNVLRCYVPSAWVLFSFIL